MPAAATAAAREAVDVLRPREPDADWPVPEPAEPPAPPAGSWFAGATEAGPGVEAGPAE